MVESKLCRALRTILGSIAIGEDFTDASTIRDVLWGLEYFLPATLAEIYPHWKYESLDGFGLSEATKVADGAAELRGYCILISDQTITPFYVRLGIAAAEDQIELMECRLGKPGAGKGAMERVPASRWIGNSYKYLQEFRHTSEWVYQVTFGPVKGDLAY